MMTNHRLFRKTVPYSFKRSQIGRDE